MMRVNYIGNLSGILGKGFSIAIVCMLIASCGLMGWGESLEEKAAEQEAEEAFGEGLDLSEPDSEVEAEEDGELAFDLSKPASDGSDLITGPSEPCPTKSTGYNLWYDHTCVLKMSGPDEEFYSQETSEFYPFFLTIQPDGKIVHDFDPRKNEEDIDADVFLDFYGTIKSESAACRVTTYTGRYPIRAEITGSCENGLVDLHVKLVKIDVNITGDCQLAGGFEVPGISSAPEIDHVFVHRTKGDAYILNVPAGGAIADIPGMLNCTYIFVLQPVYMGEPDGLEIVPLVPSE